MAEKEGEKKGGRGNEDIKINNKTSKGENMLKSRRGERNKRRNQREMDLWKERMHATKKNGKQKEQGTEGGKEKQLTSKENDGNRVREEGQLWQ